MRKLATIRIIDSIEEIEGAEKVSIAKIDGWQAVVSKGAHKVGEKIIFCEIDSLLPTQPQYEFLRKNCYKKLPDGSEWFRIKTCKFLKKLSQGLVLPLDSLLGAEFEPVFNGTQLMYLNCAPRELNVGDDVTDLLGIKKYEAPSVTSGQANAKGNFPSFLKKTDQERIQNFWKEAKEKYNDVEFEVTLKLDGTSATYFYNEGKLGVCSRNLELKMDEDWQDTGNVGTRNRDTYMRCGVNQGIFVALNELGRNIAIQGEIMGEGIQGNREKFVGQSFFIFDIWDIDQRRYLTSEERIKLLSSMKEIDFEEEYSSDLTVYHIMLYEVSKKLSDFETLEDLLKYADGKSLVSPVREGLVFKSRTLIDGEVISFKVISNEFLLTEK